MTHGFLNLTLDVRSSNGRDDILLDNLDYLSKDGVFYRVPKSSTTDGMSTPAIVSGIPGFEPYGRHWFSAVLHDAAYRGTLQIRKFGKYERADLDREASDRLIREALESQGVGPVRRGIIFNALRAFGWPNFHG